jgi:hypothetical protein
MHDETRRIEHLKKKKLMKQMINEGERFRFENKGSPLDVKCWVGWGIKEHEYITQIIVFFSKPVKKEWVEDTIIKSFKENRRIEEKTTRIDE